MYIFFEDSSIGVHPFSERKMVQILGLVGIVVVALYAEIIEGIVVFEAELSDKLFSHAIEAEFLELKKPAF